MSRLFDESHRRLQRGHDTVRLADRIEQHLCRDHITEENRAFIERLDMFFLATVDVHGQPSCSYKGGDAGFVRVLDEHTLAFPLYDGNGMFLSAGNFVAQPSVGLLFVDFQSPNRLRVHGQARLEPASYINPPYLEALYVAIVTVSEVFPNCPRYVHRMQLLERSRFVPRAGLETPIPAWKQMDWASDVLPAGDPAAKKDER